MNPVLLNVLAQLKVGIGKYEMSTLNKSLPVWMRFRDAAKRRLSPLWWYAALQFGFSKIENVINLYVGAFLIPSVLGSDELGAIVPFRMIVAFAAFPMGLLAGVAVKFINIFHVGEEKGQVKALLRDMSAVALGLSIVSVTTLCLAQEFIKARIKFEDSRTYWVLTATLVVSLWMPVFKVSAQGLMRFRHMILSNVVRPVVYLVFMVLLLKRFQLLGYVTAILGAMVGVTLYLAWSIREYIRPGVVCKSYSPQWGRIRHYGVNVGTVALFLGLVAIVEPLAIRNFTPRMDSAGYYMAFMFGQIPLYISSAFGPFLFSLISEQHERGEKTEHMLHQSVMAVLLVGIPLIVFFFFGSEWLLGLRASWKTYVSYAPLVWKVSVISVLQGMLIAFLAHENACSRFQYVKWFAPVLAAEIVLLYGLMGWHVFRPWVPSGMWEAVHVIVKNKLAFAVWMMMATRVVLVTAGVWCFGCGRGDDVGKAEVDAK